jgi:hypothetical protein
MAGTLPRHAAAVADGGKDALDLPDALVALNMRDKEDTPETSDDHSTEDTLDKAQSPSTAKIKHVVEDHDVEKAKHAALNTVSSRTMRSNNKTSLTLG